MKKPSAQDCHALISYFSEKSGQKINRTKARWVFDSLLRDYAKRDVYDLVDFYIEHYEVDFSWFEYNYDKVLDDMDHRAEEAIERKKRRNATKERLERWNRWKTTLQQK